MSRSTKCKTPAGISGRELAKLKKAVEKEHARLLSYGPSREADIWGHATRMLVEHDNPAPYEAVKRLKLTPVPIAEFVESSEFLGDQLEVWPALWPDTKAMNPDVFVGERPVHEALLAGAISTGKTTLAEINAAYQLYLFCCLEDPQGLYDLSPHTRIVFLFQSVSRAVTQRVIYEPFRAKFEAMPFAQRWLKWKKNKQSALELDNGIHVVQELASVTAMAGQAVAGSILDEANFMTVTQNSKRTPGPRGLGGLYDQAEETYRHVSRRRKSRFTTRGISIGTICALSSTRYVGDFMDRRIAEVERLQEKNVHVVRHRQYDVVPQDRFSGPKFRVVLGTEAYATRVLDNEEQVPEGALVEQVPVEYEPDFLRDPDAAQRDIIGIPSNTIHPFIRQRHKIVDAILRGRELGLRPWVDRPDVDLDVHGLPQWNEEALPTDRNHPRFVHVDLSVTRDCCAVGIVKWVGHVNRGPGIDIGTVESLPMFVAETVISIKPSQDNEIILGDIRSWLVQLRDFYGINIAHVSYDGFQSQESLQALRRAGIRSSCISVDRTPDAYDFLKDCLYQDRIALIESEQLKVELAELEFNERRTKIDHPPKGAKDVADALCGAVFAASTSRKVRSGTGPASRDLAPRQRPTRERRNVARPPARERRPGWSRRKTAGQILKEERDAHYEAEYQALWIDPKKLYGSKS